MFDTNVSDMPIEIFGDYISDCLGIDFEWIYLVPMLNGAWPGQNLGYFQTHNGCKFANENFGHGTKIRNGDEYFGNGFTSHNFPPILFVNSMREFHNG